MALHGVVGASSACLASGWESDTAGETGVRYNSGLSSLADDGDRVLGEGGAGVRGGMSRDGLGETPSGNNVKEGEATVWTGVGAEKRCPNRGL